MWAPNTITGNKARGTGLINNIRYVGRSPYERLTYRVNPETGQRLSFLNPADMVVIREAPEFRIISDELWAAVKARQACLSEVPAKRARATPGCPSGKGSGPNTFSPAR
jgi:site-specific DNA recombinase